MMVVSFPIDRFVPDTKSNGTEWGKAMYMKNNQARTVYLISGPAGVGKSTISTALANTLAHSAYISGDDISHMHINGRKKPWESKEELSLIWDNILSLVRNFVQYGNDVVVDYIAFPQEAIWLSENVKDLNATVMYVVLWADAKTLMQRDGMRAPEQQMGERCLILLNEFHASGFDRKHLLDTSEKNSDDIGHIVCEILNSQRFCVHETSMHIKGERFIV
ncbi:AAA family ATPase [Geobacillus proteiniphilus]|uniref:AAA family ATPase n=2 Tax=Anoxybacillaceae TaxID=3120669 RepID=A0ABY9MIN0_9BACL|nr:AAA family ATPase [Geobacillus proteiniphilus]WMJ17780.1 AAA family ATPase [Geobacillus proteiniphilus]